MSLPKKSKSINEKEAFLKISSFCAYQERTHDEVRKKLYEYGINKDAVEELISRLITENFINEERFAKSFAGGKFRMKKWGRLKIENELKARGLSAYCIRKGMAEIEDVDYEKTLKELIAKKSAEEKEKNPFKKKHKISQYLIRKGYEPELVWEKLKLD